MEPLAETNDILYFLRGGGEMGEMIRATDWNTTPLGDPHHWPQSLRTAVSIVLDNPFGMYIAWGSEYTQLYNDGYRPILGSQKHPQALGISTRETFAEIWHIIGPMFDGVMQGKAVGFPDFMLPLNRNGFEEQCYFDFSYSPIRKDDGQVGGVLVTVLETTDRKKSQEALSESEENFRTMTDNIAQLAWITDATGSIHWYNKRWFEYTGTTLEQTQGWQWRQVHHPDHVQRVEEKFRYHIARGEFWEDTFPLRGADGQYRWFLSRATPIMNSQGKTMRWFGTNTDITERMAAEQALKQSADNEMENRRSAQASEQKLRMLVESAPFPISVYAGPEMRIELANQSMTDIWGKGQDVIGKSYMEIMPELANQAIFDQVRAVLSTGIAFHAKNQRVDISVDNILQPYYFSYSFTPLHDSSGAVYGVMNTGADVTDLNLAKQKVQESERSLRQTIMQAPVAMCLFKEPNHLVSIANERMCEFWGKSMEEVSGKPIFEGLPEARNQGFEALLDSVYTTGETVSAEGVAVNLPRNGTIETVYVNFVYEAYREDEANISGVMAVAIDVTAQVMARQEIEEVVAARTRELADSNRSLQQSNAELGQFAYIASHDLQEPLRKISTFTQMLESRIGDNADGQAKNYIHKIKSSSSRMSTLIRNVLAYSELVRESKVWAKVDLNQIVQEVLIDYELMIDQKQADIRCESLPSIEAIPLQMLQLFTNLVSNSLKFARKDGRLVMTIRATPLTDREKKDSSLDQSLDYFKIQFQDNGIGFKQEHAEKIFGIFQRLHGKSEYEGTGIGLAMCLKIAVNHEGAMNAHGSSENGAIFNVILPARQREKPRD